MSGFRIPTADSIKTTEDATKFLSLMINDLNLPFNPDEPVENYVNGNGAKYFSPGNVAVVTATLNKCREVFDEEGASIYDVCTELINKKNNPSSVPGL